MEPCGTSVARVRKDDFILSISTYIERLDKSLPTTAGRFPQLHTKTVCQVEHHGHQYPFVRLKRLSDRLRFIGL